MRFLQRLAAIAMPDGARSGAVRAALPSRFEPARVSIHTPWDDAPTTVQDFPISGTSPDRETISGSIPPEAAPPALGRHREAATMSLLPPSSGSEAGHAPGDAAQTSLRRTPAHSTEPEQPPAREQRFRGDHPHARNVGTPPLPSQPLKHFAPTEPTGRDPILPSPRSAASDLATRFSPAAVPGREAPLRAETVAAHAHAAPAAAPIIHVTIDRLEVRAPAASRPQQPARTQTRAPSVSLADYLRGAGAPDRARGRT